jgi:hypothetical protein
VVAKKLKVNLLTHFEKRKEKPDTLLHTTIVGPQDRLGI